MKFIDKMCCIIILIIFISFMITRDMADFTLLDWTIDTGRDFATSEEGQSMISDVKDISLEIISDFLGVFKYGLIRVREAATGQDDPDSSDTAKPSSSSSTARDKPTHKTLVDVLTDMNERTRKKRKDAETEQSAISDSLMEVPLIRVVDGDTIVVLYADEETKVRLIGIDTPESVNPDESRNSEYGETASRYTKSLLYGKNTVFLQFDEERSDMYGRTLAYVWLKGDVDVNDTQDISNYMLNGLLITNGYAIDKMYLPNIRYADTFSILRADAYAQKAGLWAEEGFHKLWEE